VSTNRFRILELIEIARKWATRAAMAEAAGEPWAPQYRRAAERAARQLDEARANY